MNQNTGQFDLFPKPEPPKPVDYDDLPRRPGRDMPCLRHDSYHSRNECRRIVDEAMDAFEASGGFEGRSVSRFHTLLIDAKWEYCGYYIENDGSYTYSWHVPKAQSGYSINVKDWDGTLEGLKRRMEERDSEINRILGRNLL